MSDTNLAVAVRLKADATAFVGPTRSAVAEVERLTDTAGAAGEAARKLSADTAAAAAASRVLADDAAQTADGLQQVASAASTLAAGQQQLGAASAALAADVQSAGAAQKDAATASAVLAREIDAVGAATGRIAADQRDVATAAEMLAGEQRSAATALEAVSASGAGATAALDVLAAKQRDTGAASAEMVASLRGQDAALDGLVGDYEAAQAGAQSLTAELAEAQAEIVRLNEAMRASSGSTASAMGDVADASTRAGTAQGGLVEQQKKAIDTTALQRAGYMQLGAQLQDIVSQASTGTSIFTILAQQGGQIAAAIAMIVPQAASADPAMDKVTEGATEIGSAAVESAEKFVGFSGAIGRAAAFMAGPWGAIALAAATVLGKFAWEAYNAEEATEAATLGVDALGEAQSVLGGMFDLVNGKLEKQNELLLLNARYTGIKLRAEAAAKEQSSADVFDRAGAPTTGAKIMAGATALTGNVSGALDWMQGNPQVRQLGRLLRDADRITDDRKRAARYDQLLQISDDVQYDGSAVDKTQVQQAIIDRATARQSRRVADSIDASIDKGVLDPSLRRDAPDKRSPKPKSTDSRDEFGRDAAARIAGMVREFDGTPEIIDEINGKVAQLDDLIEDLGRRKPPGFEGLIASAEAAKATVRNGLIKSVADAFKEPEEFGDKAAAAIADLDAVIADLSEKKPIDWEKSVAEAQEAKAAIAEALNRPMDEYLRQQDEASQIQQLLIAGRRDEAEALDAILRIQQTHVKLTDAEKQTILDTVRARRAEAAELERVRRIQGQYLDAARDTADVLRDATDAFVRGDLFEFLKTPAKLVEAVQRMQGRKLFEGLFGEAFAELERELLDGPVEKAARRMAGGMDTATAAVKRLGAAATGAATEIETGEPADIKVEGKRSDTPVDPRDPIERALAKAAASIADLFTSPELAKEIGDKIGQAGATALKGAATGKAIATVADQLGFGKLIDGTGAQIGGAIGALTGIPGGQIIGSILGGLTGSLFEGPTRSGYSSIGTDANGNGTTAISGGRNSEGRQKESLTYADAVLDGLAKIAGGLGGRLGSGLDLGTIGTQGDKYVFDPDGAGSAAGSKFDTLDKAVEAALSSAISKGAVTGLSDAVRKALASSPDVDEALAEALKVKQLETLLGGVGGQIGQMFSEFDNLAADRVRLAKSYGLDLLAVEKKNAEERAALLDEALKSRVGSLQALLDDMRFGDLFEGDATERRKQILSEIEDAKQDAEAGVVGAADRVAELYRLLLDTTREGFGTAGDPLANDRALVQSGAADIIKRETDRINAAAQQAKATTEAVVGVAKLTDETNDLIATTNARLASIENALTRGSTGADLSAFPPTARLTTM